MICSSLCRVPFITFLLSCVWENSHSRRSSFRGLGQTQNEILWEFVTRETSQQLPVFSEIAESVYSLTPKANPGRQVRIRY